MYVIAWQRSMELIAVYGSNKTLTISSLAESSVHVEEHVGTVFNSYSFNFLQ
jgi:hypothetical protein